MITIEFLQKEIETLETQRLEHLAAANAAGGAIEGFKYLIEQLKVTTNSLSPKDLENLTGLKYEGVEENSKPSDCHSDNKE